MSLLDNFVRVALDSLSDSFNPTDYDWWCDNCDASLNSQPGFDPNCGTWICTECGCENVIDESEVIGVGWVEKDDDY